MTANAQRGRDDRRRVGVVVLALVGVASWCTARTGDIVWWMAWRSAMMCMVVVSTFDRHRRRVGGARGGLNLNTHTHVHLLANTLYHTLVRRILSDVYIKSM